MANTCGIKRQNKFSKDLVARVVVEAGICADFYIAKMLSTSVDLFVGIDGNNKNDEREFLEIEFGGKNKTTKKVWNYCITVIEVQNHTAQKMMKEILNGKV